MNPFTYIFKKISPGVNTIPISLKNIKGTKAWLKFVLSGFSIGLMTGFFGIGGGLFSLDYAFFKGKTSKLLILFTTQMVLIRMVHSLKK